MKWILASDDSGHDYCIPAARADEFRKWVEDSETGGDGLGGEDFTDYMLGGCPSQLEFENPTYRGQSWESTFKEKE